MSSKVREIKTCTIAAKQCNFHYMNTRETFATVCSTWHTIVANGEEYPYHPAYHKMTYNS